MRSWRPGLRVWVCGEVLVLVLDLSSERGMRLRLCADAWGWGLGFRARLGCLWCGWVGRGWVGLEDLRGGCGFVNWLLACLWLWCRPMSAGAREVSRLPLQGRRN